eukprot:5127907-Prymnesium_polylepis.2
MLRTLFMACCCCAAAASEPRQIISLSVGSSINRTWGPEICWPRVRQYASRVGASFRVITREDEVSIPTTVTGAQRNVTAYILTIIAVYDALETHDEVLLIDDTVFIASTADDIFAACPPEVSGANSSRTTPTVVSQS